MKNDVMFLSGKKIMVFRSDCTHDIFPIKGLSFVIGISEYKYEVEMFVHIIFKLMQFSTVREAGNGRNSKVKQSEGKTIRVGFSASGDLNNEEVEFCCLSDWSRVCTLWGQKCYVFIRALIRAYL